MYNTKDRYISRGRVLIKKVPENRLFNMDVRPKDPVIPKGCQEYHFHGFSCIASSEKAALKKYSKFKNKCL